MSIIKARKLPTNPNKSEWEAVTDDIELNSGEFIPSYGLSTREAQELLRLYGKNELPEKKVPKWYIFLSLFWEPMPVMIWIAIIIEAIYGNGWI